MEYTTDVEGGIECLDKVVVVRVVEYPTDVDGGNEVDDKILVVWVIEVDKVDSKVE